MQPFDREYWKKREDQLKEAYILRGLSRVMGAVGVVAFVVALFFSIRWGPIAWFPGLVGFILTMASLIMYVIQSAQFKASEAIREEYEHMMRYGEKPKRNGAVHLSDDGELVDDDDDADYQETKRLRKSRFNSGSSSSHK
jgi:hypothetical protein